MSKLKQVNEAAAKRKADEQKETVKAAKAKAAEIAKDLNTYWLDETKSINALIKFVTTNAKAKAYFKTFNEQMKLKHGRALPMNRLNKGLLQNFGLIHERFVMDTETPEKYQPRKAENGAAELRPYFTMRQLLTFVERFCQYDKSPNDFAAYAAKRKTAWINGVIERQERAIMAAELQERAQALQAQIQELLQERAIAEAAEAETAEAVKPKRNKSPKIAA